MERTYKREEDKCKSSALHMLDVLESKISGRAYHGNPALHIKTQPLCKSDKDELGTLGEELELS